MMAPIKLNNNKISSNNKQAENMIKNKQQHPHHRHRQQPRRQPSARRTLSLVLVALALVSITTKTTLIQLTQAADLSDRFSPFSLGSSSSSSASAPSDSPTSSPRIGGSNGSPASSSLVWQPLPLRATFRPLNRQQPPTPPTPPTPPVPPSPPTAPSFGEPLALISDSSSSLGGPNSNSGDPGDSSSSSSSSSSFGGASEFPLPSRRFSSSFAANSFTFSPTEPSTTTTTTAGTTTTTTSTTTTARPSLGSGFDDEDLPTRQPLNRFRPTRAPSEDEDSRLGEQPPSPLLAAPATGGGSSSNGLGNPFIGGGGGGGGNRTAANGLAGDYEISNECYECICEASTSCNANSRCQTSDVRHTRCGLFLISYDQWLATGLSRQLVTREALARDAAADERAFYECVTTRDCAERLLAIYLQKNNKDCDKDGRIDCYDLAAIHHSGMDQCSSESLLDSQYWSDFNACFGFGR